MPDEVTGGPVPHGGSRPRTALAVMVGLSLLGDVGLLLLLAGSPWLLVLVVVFFFAVLGLVWTAVFSVREEPTERLVHLIKALRGRSRR